MIIVKAAIVATMPTTCNNNPNSPKFEKNIVTITAVLVMAAQKMLKSRTMNLRLADLEHSVLGFPAFVVCWVLGRQEDRSAHLPSETQACTIHPTKL